MHTPLNAVPLLLMNHEYVLPVSLSPQAKLADCE
jgi:hypothetical protein